LVELKILVQEFKESNSSIDDEEILEDSEDELEEEFENDGKFSLFIG